MTVIAIAIKSTSEGPVLFRQQRIGKDGRPFEMLKFRTMRDRRELSDLTITREGDSRNTPLGKVLRKSKLDELPQLFNVMVGDMSLVGPRPDIAEYCETLPAETRSVLKLRPGLTGWSTLQYRNEERLLAKVPEQHLAHYYVNVVFPEKARLALEYARHATFSRDLEILLRTLIGT